VAHALDDEPVLIELPVLDAAPRMRADAERNREKVLDAAARLFAEHGVERVSMDQIAAAAGVGKGTLFRRFGDRAGLAQALLHEQTSALQEDMIRGPAPLGPGAPPRDRLHAMARAQLALLERHADLILAAESGRPGARYMTPATQFLRTHLAVLLRDADPRLDSELVADVLLSPLTADSFVYWRRVRGHSLDEILAAFVTVVDGLILP
jgi:AcrR family transcriptional regulator